jgi:hypothetical protein
MKTYPVNIIDVDSPLYPKELELRNQVLLRPFSLPDNFWIQDDSKSYHFIVKLENQVIACALLCPRSKKVAQIMQMAVDPNYQMKKMGYNLLKSMEEKAKSLGVNSLFCHSRENAIGFYSKHGFEVISDEFIEVGIKHKKMEKNMNV